MNLVFLLEDPYPCPCQKQQIVLRHAGFVALILTGSNFINLITMSVFKGSDGGDVEGEKGTSKQQLGRGLALNFQLWVRCSSGTADEGDEQHRKTSARVEMEEIASASFRDYANRE